MLHDYERLPGFSFFAVVHGEDALEQRVRELLEMIRDDNVQLIADMLADIKPRDVNELEQIVNVLMKTVLSDQHGCETYARIAYFYSMSSSASIAGVDGEPVTFRKSLLLACQSEFETSLTTLELTTEDMEGLDPEEISLEKTRRKNRLLAIVRFVGHLFVGNVKFFDNIALDLTSPTHDVPERVPEERAECVIELLQIVERKFGKRSDGIVLIHKLIVWLMRCQPFFSSGLQLQIQSFHLPSPCVV